MFVSDKTDWQKSPLLQLAVGDARVGRRWGLNPAELLLWAQVEQEAGALGVSPVRGELDDSSILVTLLDPPLTQEARRAGITILILQVSKRKP